MRVLYFHQYFTTPKLGGGTRSYEFAKALTKGGHQVTMVCGGSDEAFKLEKVTKSFNKGEVEGIKVIQIRVNTTNKDGLFKRAKDFLKFGFLGVKVALKEEYDVLFATSTPLTAGIPGIFANWFRRKKFKFIFEVRDLWPEIPKAMGLTNPLVLWGMHILEKKTYRKSDACIGLSPGICEGIAKKSKQNHPITLIPNGSDLDLFVRDIDNKADIKGVKDTDTVAIFPGAHGIANGLDAVMDAANELKKLKRDDIKLLFVGDGMMKPHLQKRAKNEDLDNCIFIDKVSKIELNKIMNRADIGLMVLKNVPAFYYGTSPNKFFDYIAASLPVINNYPGWLADMISEYNCGIAVPPNKPSEFAEALIELADNPNKRAEMGENSRKLAVEKFDRIKLADKFVGFLEEISIEKENPDYSLK